MNNKSEYIFFQSFKNNKNKIILIFKKKNVKIKGIQFFFCKIWKKD